MFVVIVLTYCVSLCYIVFQANARQLLHGKVPVVCAVIESVTARGVDAGVTLRDPTGEKQSTHCSRVERLKVVKQSGLSGVMG